MAQGAIGVRPCECYRARSSGGLSEPLSLCGADRVLELAVLDLFLTIDAIGRPGQGLEAFDADGLSATEAFAVSAFSDAIEGGANPSQLDVAVGALAEEQLFLVRGDCLVGDVLGVGGGCFTSLLDGGKRGALQVGLLAQEFFLKMAGI
jgi:hypothetical protein